MALIKKHPSPTDALNSRERERERERVLSPIKAKIQKKFQFPLTRGFYEQF
jgi:hypothetical protein